MAEKTILNETLRPPGWRVAGITPVGETTMTIIVRYSSIDSYGRSKRRVFKTLATARRYAQKWVGRHPDLGSSYAISGDGVGKITVSGDATLTELFADDSETR